MKSTHPAGISWAEHSEVMRNNRLLAGPGTDEECLSNQHLACGTPKVVRDSQPVRNCLVGCLVPLSQPDRQSAAGSSCARRTFCRDRIEADREFVDPDGILANQPA